jgi:stage II sporulation protein D
MWSDKPIMTLTHRPLLFSFRLFFAFILFVLFSLPLPFPALADDAARKMLEAETHFNRGEYLEALSDYQEILEQPKAGDHRPKALMMSAIIYSTFLKDHEAAIALYGQVRTKYPGSVYEADALFETAMILYEKGRYGEASHLFGLYLQKFPSGNRRDVASFMRDASDHPPSERERREREQAARPKKNESIRVLVLEGVAETRVSSASALEIRNPNGGALLQTITTPQEARVRFNGVVLSVNGKAWPVTELVLSPARGGTVRVNGVTYRGSLRLIVTGQGRLNAVNLVGIEEYLYGVVPKEMPPNWPEEALKAQAVVSRTFARYQMEANAARGYDISATTASQVYGGVTTEVERTRRAVDATRGQILTFTGKPALTYFHANSGGMTEDARHVWRVAIPYLQSIPDDYSARAPGASWSSFLSFDQIRDAMRRNGIKTGQISDLETASQSPSGRAIKLKITHSAGTTVLGGNQFRTITDPAVIKSTLFKAERNSQGIRFEGRGSGHGVGLSQWGARMMAEGGSPYREILLHYYKGLELN